MRPPVGAGSFRGLRQLADVPGVAGWSKDQRILRLPRIVNTVALSQHLGEVTGGTGRRHEERAERMAAGAVVNGRVAGLLVVTLR